MVSLWRKENPLTLVVGMQIGATTLENNIEVPQNITNRITSQSSNCTMRYLPEEYINTNLKDTCTLIFIAPLFTCICLPFAKYLKNVVVLRQKVARIL